MLGAPAEHLDCALGCRGPALDSALDALYGEQERGAGLGIGAARGALVGDIREHFPGADPAQRLLLEPLMRPSRTHSWRRWCGMGENGYRHAPCGRGLNAGCRSRWQRCRQSDQTQLFVRDSEITATGRARSGANPRHWQPERTVIPERLLGHWPPPLGPARHVVAIDQSGSMAPRWSTPACLRR